MSRPVVTNVTGEPPMPSRLPKRGSTYYFRRVVPEVLRPYFLTASGKPRTEFMESLGTKNFEQAKELDRLRGVEIDALFREARAKLLAGAPVEATARAKAVAARAKLDAQEEYELEAMAYREEASLLADAEFEERETLRQGVIASLNLPLSDLTDAQLAMRDLIDEREFDPPEVKARRAAQVEAERRAAELKFVEKFEAGLVGNSDAAGIHRVIDVFEGYAKEVQLAPATSKRWRPVMDALVRHLGHDDVGRISAADIVSWKEALLSELDPEGKPMRGARTVREVFLAAVKAVLSWGVSNGRLAENPAAKVTVRVPKRAHLRDPDFTEAEVKLILTNALLPQSGHLAPEHALARRWVPWLCAYTGARVNEITQLRAEDVRQVSGTWTIRITPEAGSQKNNRARVVPLHSHLVSQGFPEVATAKGNGPLFYNPQRGRGGSTGNPHYKKVGERLAAWVRTIGVSDPAVQPNHAWRHLFKSRARNAGMDPDAREAIPGHAPGTEGRRYGVNDIPFLAREIEKLPKFSL